MPPTDQTPPAPPDPAQNGLPPAPIAPLPPAAPSAADLLAQTQLSTPAPTGSRHKMMLIMAGGLVILLIVASIALAALGHKTKPAAQTPTTTKTSQQSNNSVLSGQQQKARNSKRQSDLASLQTQLEAFFSQNGYYPSLTDINSTAWRAANMKTLDQGAMIDPSSSSQTPALAAAPVAKQYAYQVTDSSGKSCESADTTCAKYTLTATYEGTVNGATTLTKSNLD